MQVSKLNEWLNLAASIGVIIGLLLVAYEIRQNRILAEAQVVDSFLSGFEELHISGYETDIMDVFAKAELAPRNLTRADLYKLDAWCTKVVLTVDRFVEAYERGFRAGPERTADQRYVLESSFDVYINNPIGRAWYPANRDWIDPTIVETWDRLMEETSMPSYDYAETFSERIVTLSGASN